LIEICVIFSKKSVKKLLLLRVDFQLFNFQGVNKGCFDIIMFFFEKKGRKCFSIRIKAIYLQFEKSETKYYT